MSGAGAVALRNGRGPNERRGDGPGFFPAHGRGNSKSTFAFGVGHVLWPPYRVHSAYRPRKANHVLRNDRNEDGPSFVTIVTPYLPQGEGVDPPSRVVHWPPFFPLFTRVRGRRILRSSLSRSCIVRAHRAGLPNLPPPRRILINTTCSVAG